MTGLYITRSTRFPPQAPSIMVPHTQPAGKCKSNRSQHLHSLCRLEKLRHTPLSTHTEDDKEVECGPECAMDMDDHDIDIRPWGELSQCRLNQAIETPTCNSWCSHSHHRSDLCACCEYGESSLYQCRVMSLKRRLRIGSWVSMMVILLLAACFIVRELLVKSILSVRLPNNSL
ncbi:hypothetical protein AX15_000302 [Amanita polypyramis BW_CC]|nr:hypothetical protein AX15_000302 [Amanita polypyramis BW_CC]